MRLLLVFWLMIGSRIHGLLILGRDTLMSRDNRVGQILVRNDVTLIALDGLELVVLDGVHRLMVGVVVIVHDRRDEVVVPIR